MEAVLNAIGRGESYEAIKDLIEDNIDAILDGIGDDLETILPYVGRYEFPKIVERLAFADGQLVLDRVEAMSADRLNVEGIIQFLLWRPNHVCIDKYCNWLLTTFPLSFARYEERLACNAGRLRPDALEWLRIQFPQYSEKIEASVARASAFQQSYPTFQWR